MAGQAKLTDEEIAGALGQLDGWEREGDEIVQTFECASFPDAIAFVVRIGFFAEKLNHHPDLDIRWRNVRAALSTHDAGGLTTLDMQLASEISAAFTASKR